MVEVTAVAGEINQRDQYGDGRQKATKPDVVYIIRTACLSRDALEVRTRLGSSQIMR